MNLELFNEKAHRLLSDMLDQTEARLVREGVCEPELASEYLTLRYIAACGEFIEHAAVYLESEERIAADLFLFDLAKGATKARFNRNAKACAIQLSRHTPVYFPNYHKLLRLAYLHILVEAQGLNELRRSGVLLLAAATLPGVRSDIRRELRRRGATHDALLVPDETVQALIDRANLTALAGLKGSS